MHVPLGGGWIAQRRLALRVSAVPTTLLFAVVVGIAAERLQAEEVVAEGVGTTSEEALKDAFRNSVRQVVGALVDAETLVKNDEIIDDKVLTYSGGFIKTFEEVAGSKKVEGGLHRIKIKATVERLSLESKLKAANISLKKVDGQGLFAEVVTQLDAEHSAEAILRKEFADFPRNLVVASVVGKPEILSKNGDKAEVRFTIRIETDPAAYKVFAKRLSQVLDKLATSRGDFTALLKPESVQVFDRERDESITKTFLVPKEPGFLAMVMARWMPKSFSGPASFVQRLDGTKTTLALTLQSNAAQDRQDCRYYLLDKAVQPLLAEIAFMNLTVKLSLMDGEDPVAVDRFAIQSSHPGNSHANANIMMPAGQHMGGDHFYLLNIDGDSSYDPKQHAFLFWIGPGFIGRGTNQLALSPTLTVARKLSLSLEELKVIKEAKCEITTSP